MKRRWAFQIESNRIQPDRLSAARRAGFEGAELIGYMSERQAHQARTLLDEYGLKVLTLWDPSPVEIRLQKCRILGAEYIPVNAAWDPEQLRRAAQGIQVVVYNHVGPRGLGTGTLETDFEFWRALRELDFAGLLLELSHLTIASQSLKAIISKYRRRLVAVCFTDWMCVSGVGSAYEEGYCRMGAGAVDLEEALTQLDAVGFKGWRVVGGGRERRDLTDEAIDGIVYLRSLVDRLCGNSF